MVVGNFLKKKKKKILVEFHYSIYSHLMYRSTGFFLISEPRGSFLFSKESVPGNEVVYCLF